MSKRGDVRERVAVDENQICDLSDFESSDLVAQAHVCGGGGRCGLHDLNPRYVDLLRNVDRSWGLPTDRDA